MMFHLCSWGFEIVQVMQVGAEDGAGAGAEDGCCFFVLAELIGVWITHPTCSEG
jgi:hypothetical protein